MKTKKIFFVADANSIHTVKWVDYFVDKGYEVYLATFAKRNRTKCTNIYFLGKASSVRGGNYHYLLYVNKLANLFKEIEPDSVNAHYSYSMGLISLLALKLSKIKTNFSVVCHGSDVLSPPLPFVFDMINKYILNNSDKVFVVSDQIKDRVEQFGVDASKIFIGQYGIDIATLNKQKDIDIISNRTYNSNSQIEFLLESLSMIDKIENKKIVFILPTIEEKRLDELKIKYPYIEFYESVGYEVMMDFVAKSKVYISATKSDGTSLSLLEAMQLKAIPLVSNIVSNRSWILDNVNGYLFSNQKEFIDKITIALNQDSSEMINININLVKKKADHKSQMKKIEEFLI